MWVVNESPPGSQSLASIAVLNKTDNLLHRDLGIWSRLLKLSGCRLAYVMRFMKESNDVFYVFPVTHLRDSIQI